MRFKLGLMTILAISMAFAMGFPLSAFSATSKAAKSPKKSTANKVKSAVSKKKLNSNNTKASSKRASSKSQINTRKALALAQASPKVSSATPLSTSKATVQNDITIEQVTKSYSGSVGVTRSTNMIDHQDGTRGDALDYELNYAYQVSKNYGVSMKAGYSQNLKDSEGNDFTDTSATLSKSAIELGRFVMARPNAAIIIATSKKSRFQQNLEGGLRVGTSFALNPLVNPDLSLGVSISGGQNFHEFDTNINGKVLSRYSFTQSFSIDYAIGDFSISGVFIHRNGWSYQNNMSESFEHAQEIGYKINSVFSTALGHTNSGSALKANGEDSNFALINENSSIVYGTLTLAF